MNYKFRLNRIRLSSQKETVIVNAPAPLVVTIMSNRKTRGAAYCDVNRGWFDRDKSGSWHAIT